MSVTWESLRVPFDGFHLTAFLLDSQRTLTWLVIANLLPLLAHLRAFLPLGLAFAEFLAALLRPSFFTLVAEGRLGATPRITSWEDPSSGRESTLLPFPWLAILARYDRVDVRVLREAELVTFGALELLAPEEATLPTILECFLLNGPILEWQGLLNRGRDHLLPTCGMNWRLNEMVFFGSRRGKNTLRDHVGVDIRRLHLV